MPSDKPRQDGARDAADEQVGPSRSLVGTIVLLLASARSSMDPRKWLIGGLATLLVAAAGMVCDGWSETTQETTRWPWQADLGSLETVASGGHWLDDVADHPLKAVEQAAWNPRLLGRPVTDVVEPVVTIVAPKPTWSATAVAWTRFLAAILAWSVAGMMLVRMTAADVIRGKSLSLRDVTGFGARQAGSTLSAALISLVCFGAMWGLGVMAGLFARIPAVGPVVVSVLWFLPLLLGLLMTILTIGFVVGWPLMVATIGVEDSDGFDGFSHAHGYLTDRPALLTGTVVIAAVVGSVAAFVGWVVFSLTIWMAGASVAAGLNAFGDATGSPHTLEQLSSHVMPSFVDGGELPEGLVVVTATDGDAGTGVPGAATFGLFWIRMARLLLVGYVASLFWSLVTGVYLVVRESADGIPATRMWLQSDERGADIERDSAEGTPEAPGGAGPLDESSDAAEP